MTLESRIAMLEREIAELRKRPVAIGTNPYNIATQNCKTHYEQVRLPGQYYGALMACEGMARNAFKERHDIHNKMPKQYIKSEEDAAEYVGLFKAFLMVYQEYLQEDRSQAC